MNIIIRGKIGPAASKQDFVSEYVITSHSMEEATGLYIELGRVGIDEDDLFLLELQRKLEQALHSAGVAI